MPSLSDVTSHQAMQPWTVVCSVLVASASGLWYQLDKVGDAYATQQRAADGLNLIWYSRCARRAGFGAGIVRERDGMGRRVEVRAADASRIAAVRFKSLRAMAKPWACLL